MGLLQTGWGVSGAHRVVSTGEERAVGDGSVSLRRSCALLSGLPGAIPGGGTGHGRRKPLAVNSGDEKAMVWNIGFDDGMGVTYALQELDGDKRKIEYVDRTPDYDSVASDFSLGDLSLGRPIKPDYVPTKFVWGGPKNRKLPDALWGRGMLLVSDRLKAMIEQFEPGLHQFFPIEVVFKSDKTSAARMHFLNVCTRLDSVDRTHTTSPMGHTMWRPDKGGQLVFNLKQIGNHHLWHDKHIFKGWMMSDALHDAMVNEGITGLVFHKDKDNTEFA
jgi:hypothetical protein